MATDFFFLEGEKKNLKPFFPWYIDICDLFFWPYLNSAMQNAGKINNNSTQGGGWGIKINKSNNI